MSHKNIVGGASHKCGGDRLRYQNVNFCRQGGRRVAEGNGEPAPSHVVPKKPKTGTFMRGQVLHNHGGERGQLRKVIWGAV